VVIVNCRKGFFAGKKTCDVCQGDVGYRNVEWLKRGRSKAITAQRKKVHVCPGSSRGLRVCPTWRAKVPHRSNTSGNSHLRTEKGHDNGTVAPQEGKGGRSLGELGHRVTGAKQSKPENNRRMGAERSSPNREHRKGQTSEKSIKKPTRLKTGGK